MKTSCSKIKIHQVCLVLLCLLLGAVTEARAQQKVVNGTVLDGDGIGIIGAGVMQKGTTNGVITDLEGKFSISVPEDAVLVISCVGFNTVEVAAGDAATVILEEDRELLDEVVVVGYGVQKRSSVTGSISKVESDQMRNRTITSAQDALAGKTAGVTMVSTSAAPGASSTIRVRGYSSNYSSDPLYIVDGLKVSDLSNVDANDIESIEVLKDAASAAIYGAEAGNGVILVTTKRASAGFVGVTYDFQLSTNDLNHIPAILNAKEYETWYREAGYITDAMMESYYDGVTNNNWFKTATETGLMQKHNLSLQMGSDKGQIYVGLNYLDNDGFLKGDVDKHTRYGVTMNAEMQIKPWLKVGSNMRFTYQTMTMSPWSVAYGSPDGPFGNLLHMDPLTPVMYSSSNVPSFITELLAEGRKFPTDGNGDYFGASRFTTTTNPLLERKVNQYNSTASNLDISGYVNLTPFKGFVFTSRFGFNSNGARTHSFSETYYVTPNMQNDKPSVSETGLQTVYYQWENFANYNVEVGSGHNFSAMLGTSFSKSINDTLSASVDKVTKELDNYTYLDFASGDAVKTVGGQKLITSKLSYFGRLGYSYRDKYLAEVTMRADANDLSMLSAKSRWGYFPAVSLGWVISQEDFFPRTNAFTFAKLRASWGQNGSISNLGNFMYASAIEGAGFYSFDRTTNYSQGSVPSTLGNDNLKWETSEQLDFGVDLRFFKDRLTFSADYFNKKTNDLLISGATPSLTAGNDPSPINAGNVLNRGFEFDLGWKQALGDFSYGITANLATLHNEVTYLDPTIARLEGANAAGNNPFTYFEVGYPIWYFRGYKYAGVDPATGDPTFEDLNGDGQIGTSDKTFIGSAIPYFTYGITLNAAYKGFDLLIFANGSQGNDIYCNLNNIYDTGDNVLKYFYDRRWTSSNTNAEHPRPGCNNLQQYYMSDAMVFDGSYFKIKQIQLGYSLPEKILSRAGIKSTRVYVSFDDFFLFTRYPGIDPETASSSSTNGIGIDSAAYPTARKVVFGLNLTF
jgi:TonB-dependent starch-binding outer membrane protein SusC